MKLNTLYLFLLLTLFYGCKKDGVTTPAVKTTSVQVDKNNNIATANGEVTSEGASAVTKRGFVWSTVANPTVSDALSSNQFGPGVFTQQISGLNLGATYYLRAYATNANGTTYGNQIDFKTLTAGKFASISFDSLSFKSVKVNVNIESLGDINIKSIGVCYSKTGTPSITSDTTTILHSNITDKSFSVSVKNLTVNTKYFIRSFINTNLGAFYSDEINVTTKQYTQATFGDVVITSLSNLSADAKINILTLGDAPIKSMGLCFATTNDPVFKTDSSTLIHSNKTDQIFTLALRNIKENTKYYVRGFINSDAGIAYSNSFYFTTLGRPTVANINPNAYIERTIAMLDSYVLSENGAKVIENGFLLGTTKYIVPVNGSLKMNYTITSLIGNTNYTVYAFATNNYGTGLSQPFNFLTGPTEPVINTASVTDIFGTNANSAVLVTSNGGAEITELGIVLSTKSNPTISDRFYAGVSSSAKILLSKLTYDSTYYIRAYAKNKVGITYGNEVNFTTVYKVGETGPAGGIIFYDQGSKKNGWRYMETTLKDIDILAPGGCYSTVSIFTDSAVGAGLENTNKIIELCNEPNTASRIAKNYSLNGFKDWFLPSFNELLLIRASNPGQDPAKAQFQSFTFDKPYFYQSSTFTGSYGFADFAIGSNGGIESIHGTRKDNNYVRPVRRFQ
jgi:hypothetical protein